ncbi:MAG: DUF302 domain-containing protein [Gammaproteobacteria bacterium]|nr:DUF302 domain-containing protein [Gammaproteobacteria bacterium]
MHIKLLAFVAAFTFSLNIYADSSVYTASVQADFDLVYNNVHDSLKSNRLSVVFQPDVGSKLSRFAERWGDNYNRNKLDRIKSMVFCNAWYANEISNMDIQMTALCPMHITLTHRDGQTSVNFVRPDSIAKGSKAEAVAHELTELVIKSITDGIEASKK